MARRASNKQRAASRRNARRAQMSRIGVRGVARTRNPYSKFAKGKM